MRVSPLAARDIKDARTRWLFEQSNQASDFTAITGHIEDWLVLMQIVRIELCGPPRGRAQKNTGSR